MDPKNEIHQMAHYDIVENDKVQTIKDYLIDEIARSKDESSKRESVILQLQKSNSELEQQIQSLKKQLQNVTGQMTQEKKNSDLQVISVLNENYQFETETKNLKNILSSKEKEFSLLKEEIRTHKHHLQLENQKTENLESTIRKLNQTLDESKFNINQQTVEIKNLTHKISETQNLLNEKNIFIVEQDHQIKSILKEQDNLKNKIQLIETEKIQSQNESKELSETIMDLQLKVKTLEVDKSKMIQEVNEARRQMTLIQSDLESKEKYLTDLKLSNESYIAKLIENFEKSQNEKTAEHEIQLKSTINQYELNISELKKQFETRLQTQYKNHYADMNSVQIGHQKYIGQITTKYEEQIKSLTENRDTKISEITTHYETRLSDIIADRDLKVSTLTSDFEKQIQNLTTQQEGHFNTVTERYEAMLQQQKMQFESAYSSAVKKYEEQLSAEQEQYEKTINETIKNFEHKLKTASETYENQIQAMKQELSDSQLNLGNTIKLISTENENLKTKNEKSEIKAKILQKEISKQATLNKSLNDQLQDKMMLFDSTVGQLTSQILEKKESIALLESQNIHLLNLKTLTRKKIKDAVKKLNRKNKASRAQFRNLEQELSILRRDFHSNVEQYKNNYIEKEASLILTHKRQLTDLQATNIKLKSDLESETARFQETILKLQSEKDYSMNELRNEHAKQMSEFKHQSERSLSDKEAYYQGLIDQQKNTMEQQMQSWKQSIQMDFENRTEKLEAEILKYKKQTTAISNILLNYQNEREKIDGILNHLSKEIKQGVSLNPLQDLLKVTQYELDKKELELKKMPSSSPVRSKLEAHLDDLFKQKKYLSDLIADTTNYLAKCETKVIQLKSKMKPI